MDTVRKQRLLIFIVAYHAESTIESVVTRIPRQLREAYDCEILIIDDSSRDKTFELSHGLSKRHDIPFKINVLFNSVNQGYGGNQKLGYHYAIEHGYDFVALLHGDGQYAPECLPELLVPLAEDGAAAVFGSRFLTPRGALGGGMPLYKFVGNRILTWLQNKLLGTQLSEFHSGYRLYSVEALRSIPFERNSNGFHFDTEIIIQLVIARLSIVELPIPTFYGDEICRVNGIAYAWDVVKATVRARLQEWSLFYDRRYDCAPSSRPQYESKLWFPSPPSFAFNIIPPGSTVIDFGASATLASALSELKQCKVIGVNKTPITSRHFDSFYCRDMNKGLSDIPVESSDYILLMDVIEHLNSPEDVLDELRSRTPQGEFIISSGNVAFAITRLMLLLGQFNYGRRGILDLTHTRLFTLGSLMRLLEQSGFVVLEQKSMPAPFPLALGDGPMSRFLLKLNSLLIRMAPKLFGYQVLVRAKALPTVTSLLSTADETASMKMQLLEEAV